MALAGRVNTSTALHLQLITLEKKHPVLRDIRLETKSNCYACEIRLGKKCLVLLEIRLEYEYQVPSNYYI